MSLIALFMALGGASYAAVEITGKNINDNNTAVPNTDWSTGWVTVTNS